jgi:hypothetical protein
MFSTVLSLPMERLRLVVHGLAHAYESQFGIARGAHGQQPVNCGIVVNNFNFNFNYPCYGGTQAQSGFPYAML